MGGGAVGGTMHNRAHPLLAALEMNQTARLAKQRETLEAEISSPPALRVRARCGGSDEASNAERGQPRECEPLEVAFQSFDLRREPAVLLLRLWSAHRLPTSASCTELRGLL